MDKSIAFIVNPASGFGKTARRLKSLIKSIESHRKEPNILLTRHPLHAISLTKKAIKSGAERIVVVGGDGTLNEVVNGYFDQNGAALNPQVSLAMIPSGTGSDFYRGMQGKEDGLEAMDFAIHGSALGTDVGFVEAHDANGLQVSRHFINVSSMGLSGLVAGFMKTVTRKLGPRSAYFIATMQAIRAFTAPTLKVTEGNKERTIENCSLLSFANGRYFGSGMKIAPNAKLDDGLLDVITIADLGAMFFLANGYRVYQGTHLTLSNVSEHHYQDCFVESLSKEPVYVETDGELFAQLPARVKVRERAIKLVR